MMQFRKIAREQIDETSVTLTLVEGGAGQVLGSVSTLAIDDAGLVERMDIGAMPIADAIALATQIAEFKEQEVDVFDPLRLWSTDLGIPPLA